MKTLILGGLLSLSTLFGCGAVTNAIDCNGICDRYKSCYDKNYDSLACQSRCRANANSDANYMTKADNCNNCLNNNKDCTSTTFICGPMCAGIVP